MLTELPQLNEKEARDFIMGMGGTMESDVTLQTDLEYSNEMLNNDHENYPEIEKTNNTSSDVLNEADMYAQLGGQFDEEDNYTELGRFGEEDQWEEYTELGNNNGNCCK
eukprot:Pgem_evm1s9733